MFEVAVIGAGPAGAWTACKLAAWGARVALIDASHPREKPCGGGLTARALAIVASAEPLASAESVGVRSAVFERGADSSVVPLAADRLRIASRRTFDGALLSAAMRSGAEHIPARVTEITSAPHGWMVRTTDSRLSARWIVGADGANSLVRRRVAQSFARRDLSIASGYFVRGVSGHEIVVQFTDTPAGYLWSFPRADHVAVGACAQADDARSRDLLRLSAGWIRTRLGATDDSIVRYSWPIPSLTEAALRVEQAAGRQWILVGDAAGLVDPITREGIYFALRSAELAAAAIATAASSSRYQAALQRDIYPELVRAARLKQRFFRSRFTGLLVRALSRSAPVRSIMADLVAGDQAYRGLRRRLLGTCEWRLLVELLNRRQDEQRTTSN